MVKLYASGQKGIRMKKCNLTNESDFGKLMDYLGGEEVLKQKFPLLYDAVNRGQNRANELANEVKAGAESIGRQDIFEVGIGETVKSKHVMSGSGKNVVPLCVESHFNYLEQRPCVVLDVEVKDKNNKYYGGGSYVYEGVWEKTQREELNSVVLDGLYDLTATTVFTSYGLDECGNPVLRDVCEKKSKCMVRVNGDGNPVISSTIVHDPKNKFPDNIPHTYIVYGKRDDNYVSYPYRDVPDPVKIGNEKYADIYCPFKIEIKTDDYTFFHNNPLSSDEFSVILESMEPDKYGGGGVCFNNDMSKVKTSLSADDKILTVEIPVQWMAKLTVNDLNLVIGSFKFNAQFYVNYNVTIGGTMITRMARIKAATEVVVTSSAVYVEPIKIKWGCLGKDTIIYSEHGFKPVSAIVSGERIMGENGTYVTVADVFPGEDTEIISIQREGADQIVQLTHAHGVKTRNGMTAACNLQFEDEVQSMDGLWYHLNYISRDTYNDEVYNLVTEEHENYIAGGIVVACDGAEAGLRQPQKTEMLPPEFVRELKKWSQFKAQQRGEK